MSINIQFGGTNIQRPGAYSAVDTENMTPVAAGSFKTIGIIGIPNMVNTVTAQAQTINNTVQGTITTAGNIKVTVTAANLTGSPIVCSVAVALNDTVVAIAGKIVTALQNNANINGFFSITNTGATLNLTALKAADNDTTMHVTIANDSTAGLTTSESTITIQGISAFIPYFNDSIAAKQALGECKALDLMNIAWTHGADLIAFSPVAQTGTDADWQKAIDALQSEDIDAIIAATNAQPINAKLLAHCSFMSNTANRKERILCRTCYQFVYNSN
jgi:hypothetical protein